MTPEELRQHLATPGAATQSEADVLAEAILGALADYVERRLVPLRERIEWLERQAEQLRSVKLRAPPRIVNK